MLAVKNDAPDIQMQELPLGSTERVHNLLTPLAGARAIEDEAFAFEELSGIAERESWRKEVYRPVYHMHKWWAQRLGSVFRALVIGAMAPSGADILDLFYKPTIIPDATIFDPFMGSGTTVGEALKLGARAIGRDINPVSYFAVRNALEPHPQDEIIAAYREIERDVAGKIKRWYRAILPDGSEGETLYYFWVKVLPCPSCSTSVDLFSSYVFSRNAYAKRVPEARALCPNCGAINHLHYDCEEATCHSCAIVFDPQTGPARGQKAACPNCQTIFPIAQTAKAQGHPPAHRMYAKLVLRRDGKKEYLPIDSFDLELFQAASDELVRINLPLPDSRIEPGHNTNQALKYNYDQWVKFFNARQLLNISILIERIKQIPDNALRDAFVCLLSGTLEFNNIFASFKGEGTGAVRHMFSHHILKPERTPLEANLWGTSKSSGSFSTLFERRLLRGLDYVENPFELSRYGNNKSDKVYGLSENMSRIRAESFEEFQDCRSDLYISCGDSGNTDIETATIDAVITDPPFFDNVNYSQLADFFYAWQQHALGSVGEHALPSTRAPEEVQTGSVEEFTRRLAAVWAEAHRVLKPDGLLVFSYHHSRAEGWWSVLDALLRAGFVVTASQPIKAEMSVATPKQQAKEPIDLDIILVCRKKGGVPAGSASDVSQSAFSRARAQVVRFRAVGRKLSRNDVRVILMGQLLRSLSNAPSPSAAEAGLANATLDLEERIDEIWTERALA